LSVKDSLWKCSGIRFWCLWLPFSVTI